MTKHARQLSTLGGGARPPVPLSSLVSRPARAPPTQLPAAYQRAVSNFTPVAGRAINTAKDAANNTVLDLSRYSATSAAAANAAAAANISRIQNAAVNAIAVANRTLSSTLSSLLQQKLADPPSRPLVNVDVLISRIQSAPKSNAAHVSNVLSAINDDINGIFSTPTPPIAFSGVAPGGSVWSSAMKELQNRVADANRAIQSSSMPTTTASALRDIIAKASVQINTAGLDAERSLDTVRGAMDRAVFDVYDVGSQSIRSAQSIDDIMKALANSDEAFKQIADTTVGSAREIKDIFGALSNKTAAAAEESTNYWLEKAVGANWQQDMAAESVDLAVKDMLKTTEKDVFDIRRIEANQIIDAAVPDLAGALRSYAAGVAPTLLDIHRSSPEDIKKMLRESDVFNFVLNEALLAGIEEPVVREIVGAFGHKVYGVKEFETMSPADMAGKFFDLPETGLQTVTKDGQVVFLSPDSAARRSLGDGVIGLYDAKAIEALLAAGTELGKVRAQSALFINEQNYVDISYQIVKNPTTGEFEYVRSTPTTYIPSDYTIPLWTMDKRGLPEFQGYEVPATHQRSVAEFSRWLEADPIALSIRDREYVAREEAVGPLNEWGERIDTYQCGDFARDMVAAARAAGFPAYVAIMVNKDHTAAHATVALVTGGTVRVINPNEQILREMGYGNLGAFFGPADPVSRAIMDGKTHSVMTSITVDPSMLSRAVNAGQVEADVTLMLFEPQHWGGPAAGTFFGPIGDVVVADDARGTYNKTVDKYIGTLYYNPLVSFNFSSPSSPIDDSEDWWRHYETRSVAETKAAAAHVFGLDFDESELSPVHRVLLNEIRRGNTDVAYSAPIRSSVMFGIYDPSDTAQLIKTIGAGQADAVAPQFFDLGKTWSDVKRDVSNIAAVVSGGKPDLSHLESPSTGKATVTDPSGKQIPLSIDLVTRPSPTGSSVTVTPVATSTETVGNRQHKLNLSPDVTMSALLNDAERKEYAAASIAVRAGRQTMSQQKYVDAYGLLPVGYKFDPATVNNVAANIRTSSPLVNIMKDAGHLAGRPVSDAVLEKTIAASPLSDVDKELARIDAGLIPKMSIFEQAMHRTAQLRSTLATADWFIENVNKYRPENLPATIVSQAIQNPFAKPDSVIADQITQSLVGVGNIIAYQPDARYEIAGLVEDGRVTDRGKEVSSVVANVLMVTGGHLDPTKMTADQRMTVDAITRGTGVSIDTAFPNTIVLEGGHRFGESVIKEFVLANTDDTTMRTIMSQPSLAKNLQMTVGSAYSDAGMRVDSAQANAAKIEAIKKNNIDVYTKVAATDARDGIISPDGKYKYLSGAFGGTQYSVPKGMSPVVFDELLDGGYITRNTRVDGSLRLTDEGEARKNLLVTMLATAVESTPHGGTIDVSIGSQADRTFLSFGLQEHDINLLTNRRAGIDQFGYDITQQAMIDRVAVIDPELSASIEHRLNLHAAAKNSGDLVMANQVAEWLKNGWVDVNGVLTPAGVEARQRLLTEFVNRDTSVVKSIAQMQSERAFVLSSADSAQIEQLRVPTVHARLTPSEQAAIGDPSFTMGDRLSKLSYATGDFIRDVAVGPAFEDPTLNTAIFGLGFLPTGWFAKGATAAHDLVKIASTPDGIARLADMFSAIRGRNTPADRMDMLAAAKRELTPAQYDELVKQIGAKSSGQKYLDKLSALPTLRATSKEDIAKIAAMSSDSLVVDANTAANMAFLGSMKDAEWVSYIKSIRDSGAADDTVRILENVRNGYLQVTADMFRPVAHMAPNSIRNAGRSAGLWGKMADVPAQEWEGTLVTLSKHGADPADLNHLRSLGELRNQRMLSEKATDFVSIFDKTPLANISKTDAALLAPHEIDRLLSRMPTDPDLKHGIDDIQTFMTNRVSGQADIIRSSTDYNKLSQAEKDVLHKFSTSRVFNLTPAEQQVLTDVTNKLGKSKMAQLTESANAMFTVDALKRVAMLPANHPYAAVVGGMFAVGIAWKSYDVLVGGPSFALFLSQEASQFALAFGPMSSGDDPLLKAETFSSGVATLQLIQDATPLEYLQWLQRQPYSEYWAPSLTNGLIFQYKSTPTQAIALRNDLERLGAWDSAGDGYLWAYDENNKIVKIPIGRPLTRDEYLDRLNTDPTFLSKLEPTVFRQYVTDLKSERGWTDDRIAKEWIDGKISTFPIQNQIKASFPAAWAKIDAFEKTHLPPDVKNLDPAIQSANIQKWIDSGADISTYWNNSLVRNQFMKPDGTLDAAKFDKVVANKQISLYNLRTHSPDMLASYAGWAITNNPAQLKSIAQDSAVMDVLRAHGAFDGMSKIELANAYRAGTLPPSLAWKDGLGDVVTKYSSIPVDVLIDGTGRPKLNATDVLASTGTHADKKAWVSDNLSSVSKSALGADAIQIVRLLRHDGYIDDTQITKLGFEFSELPMIRAELTESEANALRSRHATPIVPIAVPKLSVTPLATTPWLDNVVSGAVNYSDVYQNSAIRAEWSQLYASDPAAAVARFIDITSGSAATSSTRAAFLNGLPPEMKAAVTSRMNDRTQYANNQNQLNKDADGWTISGDSIVFVNALGEKTYQDMFIRKWDPTHVYSPLDGKMMTKSDYLAKYFPGVDPSKIKIDPALYSDYLAGGSASFLVADNQKTAADGCLDNFMTGGGGRGGTAPPISYPSAVTGIFVDCNVVADVRVNGVLMGKSGELIPLSPGTYTIEVSSLGYTTRTMVISVLSTRATNQSITLYRGALTICDFVAAVGGAFAVDKIHFVYAFAMFKGWTLAANEALKHFTRPTSQPTQFRKADCTYILLLATGKYAEANAMVETQVVCV